MWCMIRILCSHNAEPSMNQYSESNENVKENKIDERMNRTNTEQKKRELNVFIVRTNRNQFIFGDLFMVHSDRFIIYYLSIRIASNHFVDRNEIHREKNAKKSQNGQRNTTVALNLNKK